MTDTVAHSGMMTQEEFLAHTGTTDLSAEDFIAHFGVKGMKWGKVKGDGGGTSSEPSARQKQKALNRASKDNDKADAKKARDAIDNEIDSARGRIANGQGRRDVKEAKAQYKADKEVIGKREAKKALNAVKDRVMTDEAVASMAKSGKETRNATLLTIGAVALTFVANVARA